MPNTLYDALIAPHQSNQNLLFKLKDRPDWSYQDLIRVAGKYASVLESINAAPGDRVAVQVQKSPEAIALYVACIQRGCAFLPLNTAYTPSEVEYFVLRTYRTIPSDLFGLCCTNYSCTRGPGARFTNVTHRLSTICI